MTLLDRIHERRVHPRRVRALADVFARLAPLDVKMLDVGCGDGQLTYALARLRPDIELCGVDVMVRPEVSFPVEPFDGTRLPYADDSFDAVMFVDVLHHAADARELLREARRVARRCVLIKDHLLEGRGAGKTLRFMDRVGNARHGVDLPGNYLTREAWKTAFAELQLDVEEWKERLGLYPFPASLVFERRLHFAARLARL